MAREDYKPQEGIVFDGSMTGKALVMIWERGMHRKIDSHLSRNLARKKSQFTHEQDMVEEEKI
jgi:hypothetical protein